jgi:hypothetical protein
MDAVIDLITYAGGTLITYLRGIICGTALARVLCSPLLHRRVRHISQGEQHTTGMLRFVLYKLY